MPLQCLMWLNISVMFEGDMLDPYILYRMENYRKELEKIDDNIIITLDYQNNSLASTYYDLDSYSYDDDPGRCSCLDRRAR